MEIKLKAGIQNHENQILFLIKFSGYSTSPCYIAKRFPQNATQLRFLAQKCQLERLLERLYLENRFSLEKELLNDWFRLCTKFFYFDSIANKYSLMEHDDCHTILFEGSLEDCLFSFRGTNPTGRTNCFQVGLSPKQKVYMPYPTYQSQQAYFLYVLLDFRNGLIAIKLNISKWIKQRQIISRMICLISLQNQHTLEDQTEHLNIITFSMKCVDLLLKTQKEFKKTY
ncbi:unnamed protein product [Paramecium octaurelia]|uniref:Uncharacterized protein n=1 Tax=Paramecium octaurelia TaxID=43137 RepID=A0A8S1WR01_PAROT|nr:unnamed protein product [Paramecium octaurelia]